MTDDPEWDEFMKEFGWAAEDTDDDGHALDEWADSLAEAQKDD